MKTYRVNLIRSKLATERDNITYPSLYACVGDFNLFDDALSCYNKLRIGVEVDKELIMFDEILETITIVDTTY